MTFVLSAMLLVYGHGSNNFDRSEEGLATKSTITNISKSQCSRSTNNLQLLDLPNYFAVRGEVGGV